MANPTGFFEILDQDNKKWIEDRLKTYSRRDPEKKFESLFEHLLVTDPETLQKPHSFTKAVAFDGSLSTIEDPNVTALKIASAWKDLSKKPRYVNGILDPSSLNSSIENVASIGLLPGAGVFAADGAGSWDTKFREEFYQNLRHLQTHRTDRRYSLLAFVRRILDKYAFENKLLCPNCGEDRIDFDERSLETVCSICASPVYFTDYLTKALFAARTSPTQPMLLIERLMLHSVIEEVAAGHTSENSLEDTLFIADGSLQIFGLPQVSAVLLERVQKLPKTPGLVSFMKSGRVQELSLMTGIEDVVKPGAVAMVTSEAWKMLFKTRGEAGIYGKAFAYRTKNGQKWFSFMVPPKIGDPVDNAPILNDWSNYPHIAAICEFIEENQSNENGMSTATLELIARANLAASLPAELSRKVLSEVVHGVI